MTTILSPQALPSLPVINHGHTAPLTNGYIHQESPERTARSAHSESSGELLSMPQTNNNRPEITPPARSHTSAELNGASTRRPNALVGFADEQADSNRIPERPRGQLQRANTEGNFRRRSPPARRAASEENWEMRHGWEDQYNSSEYLTLLSSAFYMYYTDKRHETGGRPKEEDHNCPPIEWRMKDRLKTVSAALAICLNIGVDPPDVVKTNPSAKLECWLDPTATTAGSSKVMEQIGKKLNEQYETLSIRVRYKLYLDPSVDETRKFCTSLRRNAKEERVLFHYNGHGVPLPTPSGEIWVFNRNYTQYIPVSLYDLQLWLGAPSLYVYDCSHAGNIIANFDKFVQKHEAENAEAKAQDPNVQLQQYSDNIQLAACGKSESLPTNPDLPADLFTCCLTTPIEISLRFFLLQNQLPTDLALKDVMKVPGKLQERRSPLGELNWIFTAVTDTIAWNTLPRDIFRRLFRQDLMVAALFRNFLLSQRIMRCYGCHPMSVPVMPETHDHPMWESWDLAMEMVLAQLPQLRVAEEGGMAYEYQHSSFFAEQLTAFEVYLNQGAPGQEAPAQLPIVLQVLLSQVHRLRALILLSRFLDLGPWAVNLALLIGIFPYVCKLLQSAAQELKPVMIFIWARILAVDSSGQSDLIVSDESCLKENAYQYFLHILNPATALPVGNSSEHRAMSAFIIAMFCRKFHQARVVCLQSEDLLKTLIHHLKDPENPLLRQWSCLLISMLWTDFPEFKWKGIKESAHQRLCEMALDPVPEVRAAALHALNNFLGIPDITDMIRQHEESIASAILPMTADSNAMVRRELLVFFSSFVTRYQQRFLVAAYEQLLEEREKLINPDNTATTSNGHRRGQSNSSNEEGNDESVSRNSVQGSVWKHILVMSVDAHPEIAQDAGTIVDYVHEALLKSALGDKTRPIIEEMSKFSQRTAALSRQSSVTPVSRTLQSASPAPRPLPRNESYLSIGMRRTASVAAALKHLAIGGATAPDGGVNGANRASAPNGGPQQRGPRARVPAEWSQPPGERDHTTTSAAYGSAKIPTTRGFKPHNPAETPKLPLKSWFFDWAIEYFREPQMRPNEGEEPGSDDYNARLWRRVRNEKTLSMTQPLKGVAGTSKWDIPNGFFNNGSQPSKMCFHQFEDHLAIADDKDNICIWNWQQSNRLTRFSNANPPGTRINETRFINEDDQALLMTGSSDGVVRIFRNYESEKNIEVVTAFRALSDIVPSNKNAGLVLDWQQGQGKLLVAGDVKVIRVWNAATEICTNDIPARSNSCITSLTSDQVAGNVFVGGYGDGAIRVFDQRLRPQQAMVKCWRNHKQWITNVHMQRGGLRELVSGSRNGEIKLWDIRKDEPLRTVRATKDTLRTLAVHEHAPVFATGTDRHTLNLHNVNGAFLNSLEPYSSFLHNVRSTPIAATAFHPHRMMLACSALNSNHINLFGCSQL